MREDNLNNWEYMWKHYKAQKKAQGILINRILAAMHS